MKSTHPVNYIDMWHMTMNKYILVDFDSSLHTSSNWHEYWQNFQNVLGTGNKKGITPALKKQGLLTY